MSATLPLPTDQQPAYRDRKRLMWLLSVIGPAGVTIGPVAHLPKPWKFAEVFLFNDERRFKPRTLDL